MKSPFVLNIIFSLILAVLAYFLLPSDTLTATQAIAVGLLIGGVMIPQLSKTISEMPIETNSLSSATTTLYVGNLPYRANEEAVNEYFSEHGKVVSVRLMKDRRTGKRKGYGFVEVAGKHANDMINKLNDSEFQERTLKVRLAKEKVES